MPGLSNNTTVFYEDGPGMGALDLATMSDQGFDAMPGTSVSASVSSNIAAQTGPTPNYLWYLFGVVVLLVVLKWASEHERSEMQVRLVGIGMWNFVATGLMAALFIFVAKVTLNKYPVKGITPIFNTI